MVRKFALIVGIVYLLVGIMGFVPGLVHPPATSADLAVDEGHGRLLGLFPINWLHNVVHLAIGLWGIFASRSFGGAVGYAKGLAVIYGLLAILGLFPVTNTMFGLVPIYGHDVWLHAGTALVAAIFGWGPPSRPVGTDRHATARV